MHSDSYTNPLFVKVWTKIAYHNPDIGIHGNITLIEFNKKTFMLFLLITKLFFKTYVISCHFAMSNIYKNT